MNEEQRIETALGMAENPAGPTDEQLHELETNELLLQDCRDLHAIKMIMEQEACDIDVEERLRRFQHMHAPVASRRRLHIVWGTVAAVAAVFLGLLVMKHHTPTAAMESAPVMVYEADESVAPVSIARKSGGQLAVRSEEQHEFTTAIDAKDIEDVLTVIVPKGESYAVTLADGSRVHLYADSRLIFPTRFIGNTREVELRGEAYFEVAKDKEHPFVVKTSTVETTVLGTQFNVCAYGTEGDNVTLVAGSVRCEMAGNKHGQPAPVVLVPGQQLSVNNHQFTVNEVDTDQYTAWRDGFFYFDNMRLEDVMCSLGRSYNLSVEFLNTALLDYRIHFVASRTDGIRSVIGTINRMSKIHVTQEGNKLIVE